MNVELLYQARDRVQSVPVLVNMISKRVRQINSGFRPMVKPESRDDEVVDLVLREIVEGKLTAEIDSSSAAAGTGDES